VGKPIGGPACQEVGRAHHQPSGSYDQDFQLDALNTKILPQMLGPKLPHHKECERPQTKEKGRIYQAHQQRGLVGPAKSG
jgi:hypothetical protein